MEIEPKIKTVYVEKPVEVVKEVEVIKEVPVIKEVEVIKEVPAQNPEGLINLNNETSTVSRGANRGPLYAYRTNKTLDKNTNEHTD